MSVSSESPASMGARQFLRAPLFLSSLACCVISLPVLVSYLGALWKREYYQFFPAAYLTVLWFAVTRARNLPDFEVPRWRAILQGTACASAALSISIGAFRGSPWLSYCGFVMLLGVLLDLWKEQGVNRRLIYLVLPILLTVRPPLEADNLAIQKLQVMTSKLASNFLNAMQIDHILSGVIIQPMKGPALLVEEACSGVQSLFAVMFMASFIGASKRYSVVRSVLLMGTGVFWALLMNTCRVLAIAIGQVRFGVDLTTGWQHDVVGYLAMGLSIPFLLSTDRFIQFAFGGIPDDPRMYNRINVFVLAWNWLFTVFTDDESEKRNTFSERWAIERWGRRVSLVLPLAFAGLALLYTWGAPGFLRSASIAAADAPPTPANAGNEVAE